MPEIKHHFTGGKMNKDLDERLIPNGEYKDAMNIQVSTSEESEVGTVQNLLGNSLVPGQLFIQEGAFCVGSIADEKNDKLYYFIDNSVELFQNNELNEDSYWYSSTGITADYNGKGVKLTTDPTVITSQYPSWRSTSSIDLVDGQTYQVKARFSEVDDGGTTESKVFVLGLTGDPSFSYRPYNDDPYHNLLISNGNYENIFKFDQSLNNGQTGVSFYIEMFDGDDFVKSLRVSELSFVQRNCCIIEYDSKTNSITPVLVDTTGEVLKFSRDRLITGINIIDDMLFFTDNHTEPKKINIPRCIEGTDPTGTKHTFFVNEKTDFAVDMEEKHVTVLKEKPAHPPSIELTTERNYDLNYSGVINITQPFSSTNNSSFFLNATDPYNYHYDFSQLSVGEIFRLRIETDLNGNNGFNLSWAPGDELYFKPFEGENYDQAPGIPFNDYAVKAKVLSANINNFTDTPDELLLNNSFDLPSSNGTQALGWSFNGFASGSLTWTGSGYALNHPHDYAKMYQTIPGGWVENAEYEISITISNYVEGSLSFQAAVPDLTFSSNSGNTRIFRGNGNTSTTAYYAGNGTYTYTFTCQNGLQQTTSSTWSSYDDTFVIQFYDPIGGVSFIGDIDDVSVKRLDVADAQLQLEVMDITADAISVPANLNSIKYGVDRYFDENPIFEFKFPRIAYRWKYQDGEYSAISPFSQVAFLPGTFDYHPKKGFNTGMVNRVNAIKVSGFKKDAPDGVSEIEIIYKDDSAPSLYVVDTVKPEHLIIQSISNSSSINAWNNDTYIIDSEQVSRVIEENQLLRPYDNVPKKALAQEVSGSRIIYGNYTQGYNLKTLQSQLDYYPDFDFTKISSSVDYTQPSIKSLREYQVGAVFVDKYGRETPVVSNKTGATKLIKSDGNKQNKFQVKFKDYDPPEELEYFKFFIKETSGEYYNLAMDRFYEAEDDQMWLSFPSSDINKIAIDDFIILKKALDQDTLVQDETRYKVIDIQQEAPEFIKTQRFVSEEISHQAGNTSKDLFGTTLVDAPIQGVSTFKTNYQPFAGGSGGRLHTIPTGQLYIEFGDVSNSVVSDRYQVVSLAEDSFNNPGSPSATKYTFKLKKALGDDVDFMLDSVTNPTEIQNGIVLKCYHYIPKNLSQFDGKFFAKIHIDVSANKNLVNQASGGLGLVQYQHMFSKRIYNIKGNFTETHGMKWTGMKHGVYADEGTNTSLSWTGTNTGGWSAEAEVEVQGFGPYASFFRNYNKRANSYHRHDHTYSSSNHSISNTHTIGQYAFGSVTKVTQTDWLDELCYITVNRFFPIDNQSGHSNPQLTYMKTGANTYNYSSGVGFTTGTKSVDDQQVAANDVSGNSIWYIHQGPRKANEWDVDAGGNASRLNFGTFSHGPSSGGGYGIQSNYSTNAARWMINMGGVFHQKGLKKNATSTSNDDVIDKFWEVGVDGGNSNYQDAMSKKLNDAFSTPGTKFRWREDHNANVYTVKNLEKLHGQVNWASGTTSSGATSGFANQANTSTVWSNYDHGGKIAAQLSPNFSLQYRVLTADEDGAGSVPWNPVGDLGPIVGGLKLTVASHPTEASIINSNEVPVIHVATLQATHTDGSTHPITVGMILTSHSGGGTGHTYGGSNPAKHLYELLIYDIQPAAGGYFKLFLCGYREPLLNDNGAVSMSAFGSGNAGLYLEHDIYSNLPTTGTDLVFEQPTMNGYSENSCNRINAQNNMNMTGTGVFESSFYDGANSGAGFGSSGAPRIMPVFYNLNFIREIVTSIEMPTNPAIWETEPKETAELDIYYEATGYNPKVLNEKNKFIAFPIGSTVETYGATDPSVIVNGTAEVIEVTQGSLGWFMRFDSDILYGVIGGNTFLQPGDKFKITRPDGVAVIVEAYQPSGFNFNNNPRNYIYIQANLYNTTTYILPWHNCYSFGNGVESNRIRDNFNLPFISNGVKASTTVSFPSDGEEHRKHGLIFSGLYNSTSGVNSLNQFIAAEKITKDINPIYGSIQKLHSRDTDLVTLCEDKVLKILANKDAVFNADGNPQLTANQNVLGQTVPFIGEYGISKNPESFASEAYRAYFTDRVRGKVMRLSKDGLTAISDHGMKDWFKDNLSLGKTNLLGEDNLSSQDNWSIPSNGNSAVINGEAILGYYNNDPTDTSRFGKTAKFRMNNVLEVGKTYRLQFDVIKHSGYEAENVGSGYYRSITINNSPPSGWQGVGGMTDTQYDGHHVNITWVANKTAFELLQYQVCKNVSGVRHYDGVPTSDFVNSVGGNWTSNAYFYGGTVKIKNLILEEVKPDLKLTGSYDDKKDEYNITVHSEKSATVSFKEDVKGWVSFKSFTPENALSCANDYFTLKDGKLWQHHNPGVNRNTFYDEFTNSSFNAILNDMPSVVKSYHTLEYEGSQSRAEGVRTCVITGIEHSFGSSVDGRYGFFELSDLSEVLNLNPYQNETNYLIKQYRDGTLIYHGYVRAWLNIGNSLTSPSGGPTKGHLRRNFTQIGSDLTNSTPGDFEIGDIITTQSQEDSVNGMLNLTQTDGWFVSSVETNKEKGSLLEFIEKEGKWFNYIKGFESPIGETTDFGSFDIQGLGMIAGVYNNKIRITGDLNASLQVGDTVYHQTSYTEFNTTQIQANQLEKTGVVIEIEDNDITVDGWDVAPTQLDYCFFVKNQAVNMNGLGGYYADVKFENNSIEKAELFVVNSEITESSK